MRKERWKRQSALVVRSTQKPEALNNLGLLFKKTGDYAKAEPLYQEALRIRKILDSESRDVATSLNNLGLLYQAMHEYAKAEPL